MNPFHIEIRHAKPSDRNVIARLLEQLGYPSTAESVARRMIRLEASGDPIWLACCDDQVVGLVCAHRVPSMHDDGDVAQVMSLVVHENYRKRGVGRALCERVRSWAEKRGCKHLHVTSGLERERAHAFYHRIGFEQTGIRLEKEL